MRAVLASLSLLLVLRVPLSAQAGQPVGIYLVIVAPVTFSHLHSLDDTQERVSEITKQFAAAYGLPVPTDCANFPDSSHHSCLLTANAANHDNIRDLLFGRLPRIPPDSLVFIFVMSHGAKADYEQADSNTGEYDLYLDAADTDPASNAATAIRGSELLETVFRMSPRVRTFWFIDTCNAAALGPSSGLFTNADNLRTSVFAVLGSGADETSYKASFSHLVLEQLRNQTVCLSAHELVDNVNKALAAAGSSQRAKALFDYAGPCVNVAVGSGLLLVTNARHEEVSIALTDQSKRLSKEEVLVPLNAKMAVIPLAREHWTGRVQGGPDHGDYVEDIDVDLSSNAAVLQTIRIDGELAEATARVWAPSVLAQAAALSDAYGYAKEASHFRFVGIGAARAQGNEAAAQDFAKRVDATLLAPDERAALAFPQRVDTSVGDLAIARQLMVIGLPRAASPLLEAELATHTTPRVFNDLVASYFLAGDTAKAKELAAEHPGFARTSVALDLGEDLGSRQVQWLTTVYGDPVVQMPSELVDKKVDKVSARALTLQHIDARVVTRGGKTIVSAYNKQSADAAVAVLKGITFTVPTIAPGPPGEMH